MLVPTLFTAQQGRRREGKEGAGGGGGIGVRGNTMPPQQLGCLKQTALDVTLFLASWQHSSTSNNCSSHAFEVCWHSAILHWV
jgi:hypothetical protein